MSSIINARSSTINFSLNSLNIIYFVNLLIITNIILYSYFIIGSLDFSSLIIKSINTNFYTLSSVFSDCKYL